MALPTDQDRARNNGHIPEQELSATKQESPAKKVDYPRLLELGRELLIAIGENPDREGLQDTPRRWASWWREFIEYDAGTTDTSFNSVSTDQMVRCCDWLHPPRQSARSLQIRTDRPQVCSSTTGAGTAG